MRELKPIRSDVDYQEALALLQELWGADEGSLSGDKLEILLTLIDAYESEHHPVDLPDPIDAIVFRMEQQGLSRKDLEPIFGSRGRVAEVLNRRRPLSIDMIRRLHTELGIPADILIQPGRAPRAA